MASHVVLPLHTRVTINPTSEYAEQASYAMDEGNDQCYDEGTIVHYYQIPNLQEGDLVSSRTSQHIYYVHWETGNRNCYRPRDLIPVGAENQAFTFLLNTDL